MAEEGDEFVPLSDGVGDGFAGGAAGQRTCSLTVEPQFEVIQMPFDQLPSVLDELLGIKAESFGVVTAPLFQIVQLLDAPDGVLGQVRRRGFLGFHELAPGMSPTTRHA